MCCFIGLGAGLGILAIKIKAHTVVGAGEKSLLSGPGPDLHYYWEGGREKEREK